MTKDPWPFPEDTPLERARRIAQSFRSALLSVAPDLCAQLEQRAVDLGQHWVRPMEMSVADLDELLSAEQLGEMFTIAPRLVRLWGYRGHIERLGEDGKPLYRLRDVIDHMARTRQKRAA